MLLNWHLDRNSSANCSLFLLSLCKKKKKKKRLSTLLVNNKIQVTPLQCQNVQTIFFYFRTTSSTCVVFKGVIHTVRQIPHPSTRQQHLFYHLQNSSKKSACSIFVDVWPWEKASGKLYDTHGEKKGLAVLLTAGPPTPAVVNNLPNPN